MKLVSKAFATALGGSPDLARPAEREPWYGGECVRIPGAPVSRTRRNVVRRMGLWAMDAATEAWVGAPERTGLYVGYGGLRPDWSELMPALAEQRTGAVWAEGLGRLHPFWMLRNLSNNVHALVATQLGITADGATFGGENAGTEALWAAWVALESGAVERALVVSYDSRIQPELGLNHTGVLGEAAAALLFEGGGEIQPSDTGVSADVLEALGEVGAALPLLGIGLAHV